MLMQWTSIKCEASGMEVIWSMMIDDDINLNAMPPARKIKIPPKLQDSCVLETVGDKPDTKSKDGFKTSFGYPILGSILAKIECRFADNNYSILWGIHALNPANDSWLRYHMSIFLNLCNFSISRVNLRSCSISVEFIACYSTTERAAATVCPAPLLPLWAQKHLAAERCNVAVFLTPNTFPRSPL